MCRWISHRDVGLTSAHLITITNYVSVVKFLYLTIIQCVSKNIPDIFDCNLKTSYQILVIFGKNIPDTTCHQMTIQFSTSVLELKARTQWTDRQRDRQAGKNCNSTYTTAAELWNFVKSANTEQYAHMHKTHFWHNLQMTLATYSSSLQQGISKQSYSCTYDRYGQTC